MITDRDISEYRFAQKIEPKLDMTDTDFGPCIEYATTRKNRKKGRTSFMGFNAARVNRVKRKIEKYLEGITDPVLREAMRRSIKGSFTPRTAAKLAIGEKAPHRSHDEDYIRYYEEAVKNRMKQIEKHTTARQRLALKLRLLRVMD